MCSTVEERDMWVKGLRVLIHSILHFLLRFIFNLVEFLGLGQLFQAGLVNSSRI